jgi:predicted ATPase
VGRERELAELRDLLGRDDLQLVTLTGPGGTGKTRLALEVAAAIEAERDVCFVALTGVRDPRQVGAAIAAELGLEEGELTEQLRGRDLLLLLDNFEHVLPAAEEIGRLLPETRVQALVTSQAALRLRGEHEYAVQPLEPAAAVALFVERAAGFELDEHNRAAVEEICRRLDGLPLALELAAARVKLLSPQAILDRLENRLEVLTGGARDLPERHQTLRAALDWSYELLEPEEQELLARLGVFVGAFTLDAAEAVCGGDALSGLASLLDKSLLQRRGERFAMLQSVREYALFRLIERGELAEFRQRHARFFLELAERAEPELHGANQAEWLRQLTEDADDLRAATTWSLESGELEVGLRLAGALIRFWSIRGQHAEARDALSRALAQSGDAAPAVRAKALYSAGYAGLEQGDYAYAIARLEESLAVCRELDDTTGAALALAQIGWLSLVTGDLERARAASEESLARGRALADDRVTCVALTTLAELFLRGGDEEEAVRLLEETLERRRALGDRRNIANALLNLGRVNGSAPLLEEGLALARELDDGWGISLGVASLGRIALEEGDSGRAKALFAEGLALCRDRGDRRLAAQCLAGLAATAGSARLWGAAEAVLDSIGALPSPSELALRDRITPLDEQELAAGRALAFEDAVAQALAHESKATVASRVPTN